MCTKFSYLCVFSYLKVYIWKINVYYNFKNNYKIWNLHEVCIYKCVYIYVYYIYIYVCVRILGLIQEDK
jgi:hypothetical protein